MTRQLQERIFDIVYANRGELNKNVWSTRNRMKRAYHGLFDSDSDVDNALDMFLADDLVSFDTVDVDYTNRKIEILAN